jgi:hypothetical protein
MPQTVCIWCHSAGDEALEPIDCVEQRALVHPSHREALESYCRNVDSAKWRFLGGIGASILLGVAGELLLVLLASKMAGALVLGVAATVAAVTILRYPFATPETLAIVGVRRSISLARWCGYLILAIGVGLAAYGLRL